MGGKSGSKYPRYIQPLEKRAGLGDGWAPQEPNAKKIRVAATF